MFQVYVGFVSLFVVVSTSAVDWLERLVFVMTCYVSSGTLINPTHSLLGVVMAAFYCGDGCFLPWWWLLPTVEMVVSYCGDGCFLPWWRLLPTVEMVVSYWVMVASYHGDGCFLLWRWLLLAMVTVASYCGDGCFLPSWWLFHTVVSWWS